MRSARGVHLSALEPLQIGNTLDLSLGWQGIFNICEGFMDKLANSLEQSKIEHLFAKLECKGPFILKLRTLAEERNLFMSHHSGTW